MDLDREFTRRLTIGLLAVAVLLFVAYMAVAFVALVVFSVFLYYAVRPIFRFLDRFDLSRGSRAVLSIVLFGAPFLILIAYTVALIAIEVKSFLEEHNLLEDISGEISSELNVANFDLAELRALIGNSEDTPPVELVVDILIRATSAVGSGFIFLIIILIAVYYMLVDGHRAVEWFLDTYDESGVLRAYVRELDPELAETMFGNIVNVFATGIIAVITFYAYNLLVPELIEIPFPALAGALVGVGSLIPVVGIKLVYIPVVGFVGAKAFRAGNPELFLPIGVLFAVSAVLLDFIPDIFIRAKFSSDNTHNGLLMLSYIVGPTLFGFYGLFLAPMVLIAAINATTILIPYALSGEVPDTTQSTLPEFADGADENTAGPPDGAPDEESGESTAPGEDGTSGDTESPPD